MLILTVLFVVLMVLWLASCFPTPQPWAPGWLGGLLPWICVAILGWVVCADTSSLRVAPRWPMRYDGAVLVRRH